MEAMMIAIQEPKQRGDRVLLQSIGWQQFETILQELGQTRANRIAYQDGTLEIMTPLPEHEYYKETISIAIQDIADSLALDYESLGSTTWRKQAKMAGLEPDKCFYYKNEPFIRGKLQFDLTQDPPPDLALEIDMTSKSLARLPIYARLGVPEIWCYENGEIQIFLLENGEYSTSVKSLALPLISVQKMMEIIEKYRPEGRRKIRQAIRDWVKTLLDNP
jgi:Uma2 family endonuclease